ncbi:MAG: hypothetical protein NUV57_04675 [archaeon]|nr:hypothetical protein [archaeon]
MLLESCLKHKKKHYYLFFSKIPLNEQVNPNLWTTDYFSKRMPKPRGKNTTRRAAKDEF